MEEDDLVGITPVASVSGILQCLRMLADEAADLRLDGTLQALKDAIAVCQHEHTVCKDDRAELGTPAGVLVH